MGGTVEEATSVYEEGRAITEKLEDPTALALMIGRYGLAQYSIAGSGAEYARYGEEAALLAEKCDDPAIRAVAKTYPVFGYWSAGDGPRTHEWAQKALEDIGDDYLVGKDLVGYSPRIGIYHARALSLMMQGRIDEASGLTVEAQRVAEEQGELEVLTWILWAHAEISFTRGDNSYPMEKCHRSLEIAEQLDNESSRMLAYTSIGYGHLINKDFLSARDSLLKGIAIIREAGSQRALISRALVLLAEANLSLGNTSEAMKIAKEGITVANAGGCVHFEAEGEIAVARILLLENDLGRQAEIEAALSRAEELAKTVDNKPLAAFVLEERGRLADALNDTASSDQLFSEACDSYANIGATGHVERLRSELASN
jgi:tetratricopeptide (TPR) repeat protein